MPIPPSELAKLGRVTLALARFGCVNRPFYQICVFPHKKFGKYWEGNIIEQVGTFDPIPNVRNEKLVALNLDRIRFWMAQNARVEPKLLELLGLSGYLPIHPLTFIKAKKMRQSGPLYLKCEESADSEESDSVAEAAQSSS